MTNANSYKEKCFEYKANRVFIIYYFVHSFNMYSLQG